MDNVVQLHDVPRVQRRVQPYGFAKEFEESLAYFCSCNQKLYDAVGRVLEPEGFSAPVCKLVVRLAQEIAREQGSGPRSTVVVIQRAARWREAGKVTHEDVESVAALFDAVEDDGVPPPEAILTELVPVLKLRARREAMLRGVEDQAKGKDLSSLASEIQKIESIGLVDEGVGNVLGLSSFDAIKELRQKCRLPTGIDELDFSLGGGLPVGTLGFFVGGSGEGKSMALNHVACQKVWEGGFVGYATLELAKAFIEARAIANLTSVPTTDIENLDPGATEKAKRRLTDALASGGVLHVKDFTPQLTQVEDLARWVEECEQERGRKMDLLIVDYADKLGAPSRKGEQKSGYETGRIVADGLKNFASGKGMWCWTASQSRRKDKSKGGGAPKDLDDIADSMEKPRIAHIVVTLNACGDEADEILYFVAKNRSGKSRQKVGPIPHDFPLGRMSPVTRKEPW